MLLVKCLILKIACDTKGFNYERQYYLRMQTSAYIRHKTYCDIRIAGKSGFFINIFKKFLTDKDYIFLLGKLFRIKLLKQKTPIFAICDINNVCNLKCKHCYWWLNRNEKNQELTSEQWRDIIRNEFKRQHILQVNIVGGEPMLRRDIIEIFNEEMPGKFTILTNGTYPLIPYDGLIAYWISIDGMEKIHDEIRGKTFEKIEKNIKDYVEATGAKVWISMTINALNYHEVTQVAEYWKNLAESINYQFHTPFTENDPLWVPYGQQKNIILDEIISLKKKYPNYIINEENQLKLLRAPWGGTNEGPTNCPNWSIITLDHQGKAKSPCCLGGSGKNDLQPRCDRCGMSNYSSLFIHGIHL